MRLRNLLLKVHLYVGLAGSVFLVLLSVSGAVIAFEDDLNRALNSPMLKVRSAGLHMSWKAVRARVEQQEPGWKVVRYYFPQRSDESLYIRLRSLRTKQVKHMDVNQYTGVMLGDAAVGKRFTLLMHELHVNLVGGMAGSRTLVASTSALLLLSIGIIFVVAAQSLPFHFAVTVRAFEQRPASQSWLLDVPGDADVLGHWLAPPLPKQR